MSKLIHDDLEVLPAAPRYLRRNQTRAMGGYVVRGLVELLTNARDSAFRMVENGVLDPAEATARPIQIEYYGRHEDRPRFVVRDKFEGMTADDMEKKLLQYGIPSSGFERGRAIRGLNARGAKDVASLGVVEYRSVRDGRLSDCVIVGGRYRPPDSRPVTDKDRGDLKIGLDNGTVVTLVLNPEITFPQYDRLVRDLNRHIELRYHPSPMPDVPMVMHEIKGRRIRRESEITGLSPEGEPLLEREVEISGYSDYGRSGKLQLWYSEEPLELGGRSVTRLWRSEAGVLVADGHTAHDITFFDAERRGDAAARHLFGQLLLPQIEDLLLEFERLEEQKEKDPEISLPAWNPSQVTDPDRLGLNKEHPFVKEVHSVVAPIIEKQLAEIQKDITPPAEDRIDSELRESLQNLGRKLAEQLEIAEGSEGKGDEHPLGLSFVPGGMRLKPGEKRSGNLYLRFPDREEPEETECSLAVDGSGVELSEDVVLLEPHPDPESVGVSRGRFEITGTELGAVTRVRASAAGHNSVLRVSVREPRDKQIELEQDLQLSQSVYSSIPGRRKKILAFSDPSFCEERVAFQVTDENLELEKTSSTLTWDEERKVCIAHSYVYADSPLEAKIKVSLREISDQARIVYERAESDPEVEFEFKDRLNFGPGRRFQWDLETPNRLLIAAQHPTLKRVLGPDVDSNTGERWPGQHAPQTVAILAEVIAEAYTSRRLDKELAAGGLGIGPENLVDPFDYENFRYQCFEECYLICHENLTPPYQ